MAEANASLTLRLEDSLKGQIEQMAAAQGRSVSEYVVRTLEEALKGQCSSCGHSTRSATQLPGFTEACRAFEKSCNPGEPIFVATDEGSQRIVYWGTIRKNVVDTSGVLPMRVLTSAGDGPVSIPRGSIRGWGHDNEGRESRALITAGYYSGTALIEQFLLTADQGRNVKIVCDPSGHVLANLKYGSPEDREFGYTHFCKECKSVQPVMRFPEPQRIISA